MSSYTPEGFRLDFMSKTALGKVMTGGANNDTHLQKLAQALGQERDVYVSRAPFGPAYIYNLHFTKEELELAEIVGDNLPAEVTNKLNYEQIANIALSLPETPTFEQILEILLEHNFQINIVTQYLLQSRQGVEIIFSAPQLRLHYLKFIARGMSPTNAALLLRTQYVPAILSNIPDLPPIQEENTDFLHILFKQHWGVFPSYDDLLKSSILCDITTLYYKGVVDPFIAAHILIALSYKVEGDLFAKADAESFHKNLPEECKSAIEKQCTPAIKLNPDGKTPTPIPVEHDRDEVFEILSILVKKANLYGGVKHFKDAYNVLRKSKVPSWIKREQPSVQNYHKLPDAIVNKVFNAYNNVSETAKHTVLNLAAAVPPVMPFFVNSAGFVRSMPVYRMLGGDITENDSQGLPEVWNEMLTIGKYKLDQKHQKLSDNSLRQFQDKLHKYTDANIHYNGLGGAINWYSNQSDVDSNTLNGLVGERDNLKAKLDSMKVRIHDMFSALEKAWQ